MKNVTMLGGALLIAYFGAGPLSFDALVESDAHVNGRSVEIARGPLTVSPK